MQNEKPDVTFVMPCLNEISTVARCVDDAFVFIHSHSLSGEVIVVDNGSTDGSAQAAEAHGARVIPEERRGYGRAIRTGLENAKGAVIIISDCDCTYDLLHAEEFFFPLLRGEYDFIVGDRFAGGIEKGAMPPLHRLGVPFLSMLGRMRYKTKVRDFHCGLRAITNEAVHKLDLRTDGMEFATELIAEASRKNLRTGQRPTVLKKGPKERASKLHTFRDGMRHLGYIIKNGK